MARVRIWHVLRRGNLARDMRRKTQFRRRGNSARDMRGKNIFAGAGAAWKTRAAGPINFPTFFQVWKEMLSKFTTRIDLVVNFL